MILILTITWSTVPSIICYEFLTMASIELCPSRTKKQFTSSWVLSAECHRYTWHSTNRMFLRIVSLMMMEIDTFGSLYMLQFLGLWFSFMTHSISVTKSSAGGFMGKQPGQLQRANAFGLMLSCHLIEILAKFWTLGPRFPFALGLAN